MIIIARTKFNVDKDTSQRTYNDIVFDSIMEMKYYRDVLCPLMESGDVVNVELQKPYELQPNDFMNQMRKDGKFEKMIRSMTVDQLSGGSKLSKNKYQW